MGKIDIEVKTLQDGKARVNIVAHDCQFSFEGNADTLSTQLFTAIKKLGQPPVGETKKEEPHA